jgi:hypothetical protein
MAKVDRLLASKRQLVPCHKIPVRLSGGFWAVPLKRLQKETQRNRKKRVKRFYIRKNKSLARWNLILRINESKGVSAEPQTAR